MSNFEVELAHKLEMVGSPYTMPEVEQRIGALSVCPEVDTLLNEASRIIAEDPLHRSTTAHFNYQRAVATETAFMQLDRPEIASLAQRRAMLDVWLGSKAADHASEASVNFVVEQADMLERQLNPLDAAINEYDVLLVKEAAWRHNHSNFRVLTERLQPYLKNKPAIGPSSSQYPNSAA